MANEDPAPRKGQTCPNCKASVDRLAVQCPECDAPLPLLGGYQRSSRGRRYVYGKRKAHLSQEAVWLIVVIMVGLLIVFGVQVIAFMRSKKLLMAPPQSQRVICSLERSQRSPERPLTTATPRGETRHLARYAGRLAAHLPLSSRALSLAPYRRTPDTVCPWRQVNT